MGHPKQVDKDTLMGVRPFTCRTTSAKAAKLCSRVMRRFDRLCVSEVDMTKLSSSARDSKARSAPRKLGTNTVYSTPGTRVMRPITSSASRNIGIALGEVNDVTSTLA